MTRFLFVAATLATLVLSPAAPATALTPPDPATWVPHEEDPVIKELKKRDEDRRGDADKKTAEIREGLKKKKETEKKARKDLISSLPAGTYPGSPDIFDAPFHFKPQPQFMTGTCWSFAAISFLESEVARITGKKIKLAELYPVYWEYVEKAREYVRTRGASVFYEGSQLNSVTRMYGLYGAVPLAAYKGVVEADGRHDHQRLHREMSGYLKHVKATNQWDEAMIIAHIRAILDRHLGAPPETFEFEGATYTPKEFMDKVLNLDPTAYVEFMSTTREPMWTQAEFKVTDNWWHSTNYWNVPLADFYKAVFDATKAGYTVGIGGDVSEPGKVPKLDIAFVPSFDIPAKLIDQKAREYRIQNHSTGDDHGIHLLSFKRFKGHDWFLIKDSGRSARKGKHHGYYFFRGDYIKLKMLTVMVHKDAAKKLLDKIKRNVAEPGA